MRQVCSRRPWGLWWHRRRRAGETGVFVYGWFPRPRNWGPERWKVVGLDVDGKSADILSQYGPRLRWIPLPEGDHTVEIKGLGRREESHTFDVSLRTGQLILVAFMTPNWFQRPQTPTWCPPRVL